MPLQVNVSNAWRHIRASVNIAGTWRDIPQVYTKVDDVWRPLYAFAWETGEWGQCSATCGGGTQTRTVSCKRSDGQYYGDAVCSQFVGTKPETSQACNTQACVNCLLDMDSSLTTFWLVYNSTGLAHVTVNGVGVCSNISNTATECTASGITYTRGACNADVNTAVITACEVCY